MHSLCAFQRWEEIKRQLEHTNTHTHTLCTKNTSWVTLILTGRSLPGPPSGVNLGGWVLANPGDTGLLPELWSRVSETKFQIKSPDYLPQKSHFSLNMVVVVLVVLLWADSGPLCDEAGRGSLCSPLRAAEGERGRGGGVEVSGLVKGLMGGWSYSGRGGREDGSFKEGEIYREWWK